MPLIKNSSYKAPFFLRNAHANTIYAGLMRRISVGYERERFTLSDGDFVDIDWVKTHSDKLVMVLHGLEGNSDRPYVKGMIRTFTENGWDGLAMNFRSCSGENNRKLKTYHMGAIRDVEEVLLHAVQDHGYSKIVLVGYSLGGNVLLNYLAQRSQELPDEVYRGIAFSVPIDINASNVEINKGQNRLYLKRFLKSMNAKVLEKKNSFQLPEAFEQGRMPQNFNEFDEWFTAPVNGFDSAVDYWTQTSSVQRLDDIQIPTLLINARDDSFLAPSCFPFELSERSRHLYFEAPRYGGHVGFVEFKHPDRYFSDRRALDFASES